MIKELEGLIYGAKLIELNMHRSVKWQLESVGEHDIAVCNYQRGVNSKESKGFAARYSCGFFVTQIACHAPPWGSKGWNTACPLRNPHHHHTRDGLG